MSTSRQDTLRHLGDQFRRFTLPAADLHHTVVWFTGGPLTDEERQRAAIDTTWTRDGRTEYGRYWGNTEALPQFREFANRAYRCLVEGPFEKYTKPLTGAMRGFSFVHNRSSYWLAVLYALAWEKDLPSLRAPQVAKGRALDDDGSTAPERYEATLQGDVFAASAAAIDLLLSVKAPQKSSKASKIAIAIGVLAQHPDWTLEQIAEVAGCHIKYLSQSNKFKAARKAVKGIGQEAMKKARRYRGTDMDSYGEDE
jgi:hypothetical protein